MSPPDVVVIANPAAGRGKATGVAREVVEAATLSGNATQLTLPDSVAAAVAAVEEAVDVGADRVIAVGGDGLVHHLLGPLVRSSTALGIVPAGTGNDAARGLGLTGRPSEAITRALGEPTLCDVLACTGEGDPESEIGETRFVLTVATAGLPVLVNRRANQMAHPRGSLRYTVSTLLELPRLPCDSLRLTLTGPDGRVTNVEETVSLLAVANTHSFGGGTPIAPEADPTDGLADVVVIQDAHRREYLRVLPAAMTGAHVKNRHVSVHRAAAVDVELAGPGSSEVWGDGEPLCQMPLRIEVVPGALAICGLTARS